MNIDFETMLDITYSQLEKKKKITINLPNLITENSPTKIYWRNVSEYLDSINRNHDHFFTFIKNQYSDKDINWYSNNKDDGLIIHGKYLKNNIITNIFNKYINIYVICSSCKNYNTLLNKENNKNFIFICNECGMNKYIK
jgi:translation initiation factor 2 beta subunit (eIF-2beta)/eIF-5